MLILLILLYAAPVYLLFFRLKLLPLNTSWKCVIPLPPLLGLLFLWFAFGRHVPLVPNAYLQTAVIQVAPEVGGYVTEVCVRDNQEVAAESPLFRLDPRPFQYQRDQAAAKLVEVQETSGGLFSLLSQAEEQLNLARAQVNVAKAELDVAKADLAAAKQTVAKAEAEVRFDEGVYARDKALVKTSAVSQQELENSELKLAVSRASLAEAAQREVKAAIGLTAGEAQIVAAQAAVLQADAARLKAKALVDPVTAVEEGLRKREAKRDELRKAKPGTATEVELAQVESVLRVGRIALENAKKAKETLGDELPAVRQAREAERQAEFNLSRSTVTAPCTGVVSNLQLVPNTYVRPGTPVISFIAPSRWRLVAAVPENLLGRIRPDDEVMVSLRNYPCRILSGKVSYIGCGVVQGQGVPSGNLPDTDPRRVRQTDTPVAGQEFQVIVDLGDTPQDMPQRVGQTGRATIYAGGGMFILNELGTIIHYILSLTDYFHPKPGLFGILAVLAVTAALAWWWRRVDASSARNGQPSTEAGKPGDIEKVK